MRPPKSVATPQAVHTPCAVASHLHGGVAPLPACHAQLSPTAAVAERGAARSFVPWGTRRRGEERGCGGGAAERARGGHAPQKVISKHTHQRPWRSEARGARAAEDIHMHQRRGRGTACARHAR